MKGSKAQTGHTVLDLLGSCGLQRKSSTAEASSRSKAALILLSESWDGSNIDNNTRCSTIGNSKDLSSARMRSPHNKRCRNRGWSVQASMRDFKCQTRVCPSIARSLYSASVKDRSCSPEVIIGTRNMAAQLRFHRW